MPDFTVNPQNSDPNLIDYGYPLDQTEFPSLRRDIDENGLIEYLKKRLPNGYGFKENRDYLDDIPQEEITLNPNPEQNPGWTSK